MKPGAKRGLLIGAGVLAVLVVVSFFAIGPIVSGRVRAAVEKRALEIAYGGVAYRFTHAELRDATLTPKGSKRITITAPVIDARLQLFSPTWIIVPRADIVASGSVDEVVDAIDPVRKADRVLPADERLPVDVQAGSFKWKMPLGEDTAVSFGSLTAELRPKEARMHATLKNGKLELPHLTLAGLGVDVTRTTTAGEKLDVRARLDGDEGHATLAAHRHDGDKDFDLEVEAFTLGSALPKVPGLDLSKATIDGAAHGELHAGELASNGKLTFSKLKLPPIKAGPVSLSVGGSVKVSWKGTPKKGAPGTMKLDDGKIEVTLGGKSRSVKIRGDISIGEDAHGPYVVNLSWEAGPFPCSEIAGDLAGPLAKGLVSGAVSGSINAKGTIKGDLAELSSLKQSVELLEGCQVDVGKGIGGLIPGLPF